MCEQRHQYLLKFCVFVVIDGLLKNNRPNICILLKTFHFHSNCFLFTIQPWIHLASADSERAVVDKKENSMNTP